MDFDMSSEQDALRDSVRRFIDREYDWEKRFAVIRSHEGVDPAHWATFAELGWLGAGLSEEAGGFGGGAIENALIAQELGRGLVTEPFVAHVLATQTLAAIGGETAGPLIGAMVTGETRVVPAFQEEAGRGDWRVVGASSTGEGKGATVSGTKTLVEGASSAERLIVSARSAEGVGLYLVDAKGAGVVQSLYRTVDNRRVADIALTDAPAITLASGPAAQAAIEQGIDHALVTLCGEALGLMDAALWATRDYLKVRKQFGTAIGTFQALQHRMADMLIETEMARSILYHALGAMAGDDRAAQSTAASAAKQVFSTAGLFVGGQAIQLHGGIGVTEELDISHYYRRLFVIARQFGDADLHGDRFAHGVDHGALAA
ncbi:acyl-CoA dehydrogenase [Sphingobium sp. AN558]|uniref:acyl-CoA dehydrogenase family protein n=1 Tax=Sphingobium sp. AN558 TaxID=3133442 RepID=UPI0030BE749E